MMNIISVKVSVTCPFCGKERFLTLSANDFADWQNGALVQDAFPYLNADEREGLITGICSDCWEKTFSSDSDDEEEEEDWENDWPDWEEEDLYEEREDFPDDHLWDSYDLDMGFNPYMGCYDYDC